VEQTEIGGRSIMQSARLLERRGLPLLAHIEP
jgi:hypothetical protein